MKVTVQFQEPRKPYAWVNAFKATVLFADRKIILLRGAGSHQIFGADGWKSIGHSSLGATAKKIPKRPYAKGWRIEPEELKALKKAMK